MKDALDPSETADLRVALAARLSRSRFAHVERVVAIAGRLAELWDLDREPVLRAAWLHDCARELSRAEQRNLILPSRWEEAATLGWHGPAGAVLSWQRFGETDRSVLDAIKYHSVPQPDASALTKLIFVADKLDAGPTQLKPTLEGLPARCSDPDQALLFAIETRLREHIERLSARAAQSNEGQGGAALASHRRPLLQQDVAAHAVLLKRLG